MHGPGQLATWSSRTYVGWLTWFFFQAEDGIRDDLVTGVQTCALPICTGLKPMETNDAATQHCIPRLTFEELEPGLAEALRPRYQRLGYLGEFFRCMGHQPAALRAFVEFTDRKSVV